MKMDRDKEKTGMVNAAHRPSAADSGTAESGALARGERRRGDRRRRGAAGATPPDRTARDRLLACAAELFTRKGYAATTVREIVAAAGVTKPVLYYYFRNKEGIYLELMRRPFETFSAIMEAESAVKGSARERLTALSVRSYDLFVEHLDLARVMYAIYYGPPQGAPYVDFDAMHVRFQKTVAALLEEGIETGEFQRRRLEDMTWAIIGAVNIAMEVELCHPERSLGRDGLVRVLAIIFDGMAPHREAPEEDHR